MQMNATKNAVNPKSQRKRKRKGVRMPVRVEDLKGGCPNPGGFKGKGNPGEGRRSSAPPTGGRGAPILRLSCLVKNNQPPPAQALVAPTRAARTPRSAA